MPGLPHRGAVLWLNARPQFRDKFKRDAAAGARFWRGGHESSGQVAEEAAAQRRAATRGGYHSVASAATRASAFSPPCRRRLSQADQQARRNSCASKTLVYEAAKLVPGLTPTQRQVKAESALMQGEKDGVEIDQGIFLAQVLALPRKRHASLRSDAAAENGSHRAHAGIHPQWRHRLRPRARRAARQGRGRHRQQSALPQCRGRRHAR